MEEIASFTSLIISFYLFKKSGIKVISFAITISYAIAGAFAIISFFSSGGMLKLPKKELGEVGFVALPITSVRLLGSLASCFIVLILPRQLTFYGLSLEQSIAEIGLLSGITLPLLFVPSSVIGSLYLVLIPNLASNIKRRVNVNNTIFQSFSFASFVSGVAVAVYFSLSYEICQGVFLKPKASPYLLFACLSMLPMSINQISVSVLNAVGGEKYGLINFSLGGVTSIVIVLFLTRFISVYAMLLTMYVQPLVVFILNSIRISKMLNINMCELIKPIKLFFAAIPLTLISLFIKSISSFTSEIATLFAVGVILLLFVGGFIFFCYKKRLFFFVDN